MTEDNPSNKIWESQTLDKHNIKSKFPPKEPHQIVQYNKSFKLKPSMGYS